MNYTATIRDPLSPLLPTHTPQPELFSLYEEEASGTRPDRIATLSGPQERDLRRPVQQIVDAVPSVPKILLDDVPMRTAARDTQLVEQLVEVPTIIS